MLRIGQKVEFETRMVKGTGTIKILPSPDRAIVLTCCAYEKHTGVMGNEYLGRLLGNHNLSVDVWNIKEAK